MHVSDFAHVFFFQSRLDLYLDCLLVCQGFRHTILFLSTVPYHVFILREEIYYNTNISHCKLPSQSQVELKSFCSQYPVLSQNGILTF